VKSDLLEWWGFRIRIPQGYVPKPIAAGERLAVALTFAIVLELAWIVFLVLRRGALGFEARVLAPLAITLLPAAALMFAPRELIEAVGIAALPVVAREKGGIGRWDLSIMLVGAVAALLSCFQLKQQQGPAVLILLTDTVLITFALMVQETIGISGRRWPIEVPEWLRRRLPEHDETKGSEETDEIVPPDTDAAPIYTFVGAPGAEYPVGIHIPAEVLQQLRGLNSAAGGRLYQTEPLAVVLVDRQPAENVGREELLRLVMQIFSIARKHALPRFTFANMVLSFAQTAIRYQFDKNSTAGFPGGPFPDYGRFAVETLHDSVGDCECTSLLCASLLSYLGFETALLWVVVPDPDPNANCNHMAVGIEISEVLSSELAGAGAFDIVESMDGSGKRYLYGETATDNGTLPFGCIPAGWTGVRIDKTIAVPSVSQRRA
jgi:hypothetical protein